MQQLSHERDFGFGGAEEGKVDPFPLFLQALDLETQTVEEQKNVEWRG